MSDRIDITVDGWRKAMLAVDRANTELRSQHRDIADRAHAAVQDARDGAESGAGGPKGD